MSELEFRLIRLRLKLTQRQWGECLGITGDHVKALEAGRSPVTKTIAILATAYDKGWRP